MAGPGLLNIILAEDNPHDVTLARMAMKDAGLNCALRVLTDGEQTISFIESLEQDSGQPTIDLLLLDLNLPKRNGAEILRRLRSMERLGQTPVIVTSGSCAPRELQCTPMSAAVHYFRKPSDLAGYMRLGVVMREVLFANQSLPADGFQGAAS